MQNKKIIRFMQSLVLLPVVTTSVPFSGIPSVNVTETPKIAVFQDNVITNKLFAVSNEVDQEAIKAAKIFKMKAEAIDAYFDKYEMPLKGTGAKMVEEAEKNDIDWRLLPAIASRESTGGKQACQRARYNSFGWGSCKIGFKSNEEAIEIIAKNLGGNNPNTAHHYSDKTTKEILQKYNPPSIVPKYADQVMKIMNEIGTAEINIENS